MVTHPVNLCLIEIGVTRDAEVFVTQHMHRWESLNDQTSTASIQASTATQEKFERRKVTFLFGSFQFIFTTSPYDSANKGILKYFPLL